MASANRFEGRLPEQINGKERSVLTVDGGVPVLALPEESTVVDILLHAIYGVRFDQPLTGFATVAAAVEAMKKYCISLHKYLAPQTPFHSLFLDSAPQCPLEAYTIAAENEIEPLAIAVSSYTLPYGAVDMPDELVVRMGPLYLMRIWGLHETRFEAMRESVKTPPCAHPPSRSCTPAERTGLAEAWKIAGSRLIWNFKPGV